MTTDTDIHSILNRPEKENLKVEFKRSDLLHDINGQRKIGYAIVALANRYGGKLFLGVNDDGTLEGKDIFDIDEDKGIIENICHMRISPIIEYNTEFLSLEDGDILIVNVPKRKEIPHAYIVSREGPEIKNRIYYIRTSHGKRLVSDRQLQWLFTHQEDPDFSFPFTVVIHFNRKSLTIPPPLEIGQPSFIYNFVHFVNSLPKHDIKFLTKDWETVETFFLQITPYALLNSFPLLFKRSWLVEINRRKGIPNWVPLPRTVASQVVSLKDIPLPPGGSILNELSWDFSDVLRESGVFDFRVPVDTKISIHYNKGQMSRLSMVHKDFRFDITFNFSSMCAGLHSLHPQRAERMERDPESGQGKMFDLYQSIEMDANFTSAFNFPEEDVELFNEYYKCAGTIKNHLKHDWDYDRFLAKLPHYKIYTIDNKLSEVLDKLKGRINDVF